MMGDYPLGADNSSAPWNQSEETTDIDVCVCLSISTDVTIKVDKNMVDSLTQADLIEAVKEQIQLPIQEKKYSDWVVDDFEVITL